MLKNGTFNTDGEQLRKRLVFGLAGSIHNFLPQSL